MMVRQKLYSFMFGCIVAVALAGCQTTTVDTVRNSIPAGQRNPIVDERIQTDKSLGKNLSVISVSESSASGDLLKVQVVIRNNKKKAANYSYSFEWYDADGIAVRTGSTIWKSIRMLGQEEKALVAIASNPKAVDFLFKIQEANPRTNIP